MLNRLRIIPRLLRIINRMRSGLLGTLPQRPKASICKPQSAARADRIPSHLSFLSPRLCMHASTDAASKAGQLHITARKALDDGEVQDMQPGALYIYFIDGTSFT